MKQLHKIYWTLFLLMGSWFGLGLQVLAQAGQPAPEYSWPRSQTEADIRFLASDELGGRKPGTAGHDIAARYLVAQFEALGIQPAPGQATYYQAVPFTRRIPAMTGLLRVKGDTAILGDQLVILGGSAIDQRLEGVFVGQGWIDAEAGTDDYDGIEVSGKLVVADMGAPGMSNPGQIIQASQQKRRWAAERGALALVEIYSMGIPFGYVVQNFQKPQLSLAAPETAETPANLPHAWMTPEAAPWLARLKAGKKTTLQLQSSGVREEAVIAPNVVGVIPGRDPELAKEYVLLSAHYDHVGSGPGALGRPYTGTDSIYNGARDNATGVAALLMAARSLAREPAARSVILVAFTAEELGLLGSKYYADHPLVPLRETVFTLNADGAGYDDTTAAMVIGWGRTTAQPVIEAAAESLPIDLVEDLLPEMDLFGRSDQISLAKKGVPALMLSPAIRAFDEAIQSRYHTVTDGVGDLNFAYVHACAQLFAHLARGIADMPQRPQWQAGDEYEAAAKELYQP
jgi:hypothetical protein